MSRGPASFGAILGLLLLVPAAQAEGTSEPTLTRAPRLKRFVEAEYPESKRVAGETAAVVLTLDIDETGRVTRAEVATSGGPEFDRAAMEAASRFEFEPAEVDGKPAAVRIAYRYVFKLVEAPRAVAPAGVRGRVVERKTGHPVVGAEVRVLGTGLRTSTDAQGQFTIDLAPGEYGLGVAAPGFVPLTSVEHVDPGAYRPVTYALEARDDAVDEEVMVRSPRLRRDAAQTQLRAEEARRVPGTQGDTLKVVQSLPGVSRSSMGSGQLVVWGSAPRDTRVSVDGVDIPALYHLGGVRSTLGSDLVSSIALVNGAFGAEHGRALGGLVRVETRPLPSEGIHGNLAADLLDGSGFLAAGGGRWRVAVQGRYGWLDRLLTGLVDQELDAYVPLPRYHDLQLKAALQLRSDEELSSLVLVSSDELNRTVASRDPASMKTEKQALDFWRAIVSYRRLFADGSSITVTPSVGRDRTSLLARFGSSPTQANRSDWTYGLRASYREQLGKKSTATFGVDVLGTVSALTRLGSVTLPPREGDISVFGQPPATSVAYDEWSTAGLDAAPFITGEFELGSLRLVPGLRVDAYSLEASRQTPRVAKTPSVGQTQQLFVAEPRLQAAWRATPWLTLTAASGLYHQPPESEDLSAVFGTPTLGLSRAFHLMGGARVEPKEGMSVEAQAFYKELFDLPTRSPLETPELAHALVSEGRGRSYGGQLMVRRELIGGFMAWLSYALARAERQDHPGGEYRLFDFDQTHVLTAVASYSIGGFTLGARFRLASGFPRTPVVGSFFDAQGDQYQPLFGAQNSIRIPPFAQLDLRVERDFLTPLGKLTVSMDIQNAANRQNPEELVYSPDYSERGALTGLPFLAVAGARWEF